MKKLIALILTTTLLLSGCSLFGQEGKSGSLSDKLAEVDRVEGVEPETTPEFAQGVPGSLSFAQLDPYDMLSNGWDLTPEVALEQYNLAQDSEGRTVWGELPQTLPGTLSCTAGADYNEQGTVESFWYFYDIGMDDSVPYEDTLQLFRHAIDAVNAEFQGHNQVWDVYIEQSGKSLEELDDLELMELARDSESISCYWGVPLADRKCVVQVSLDYSNQYEAFRDLAIGFRYNEDSEMFFPDDVPADVAPTNNESSETSAAEEKTPALYTEPDGSPTAMDMVRLGTYMNDDVFGVGLVWSVTFYNDYTFDFSYDHEEGTEYFTGNWYTEESGGELWVFLNVTNTTPFTISLDVDGGKYMYVDDYEFWPDVVVLPFVG